MSQAKKRENAAHHGIVMALSLYVIVGIIVVACGSFMHLVSISYVGMMVAMTGIVGGIHQVGGQGRVPRRVQEKYR